MLGHRSLIVFPFIFTLSIFQPSTLASISWQGWGKVNMQGAIIDTACSISVNSRDQTIDMETVPVADIIRDGQGRRKAFSIELINCILERPSNNFSDWRQFQVTFDGDAEGNLFGVHGTASGIALKITDEDDNIARPGDPLRPKEISTGNMQLKFNIRLVANSHTLKSGDYFSVIRFKLDYF